jgi:hypothetical protein
MAAQDALDRGETARALELTESALPSARDGQDRPLTWRLLSIGLQALAEEGRASDALATLERVASTFPTKVDAPLYARLANRATKAGEQQAGLTLAHAGVQRFPGREADFDSVIEDIKRRSKGNDSAMELLYSLGYVSKPQ